MFVALAVMDKEETGPATTKAVVAVQLLESNTPSLYEMYQRWGITRKK